MLSGNLFTRDDTFFGVCEGLGEDLGIHSNWLRIAVAGLLFWSPLGAMVVYAAAGVLVLATRLLVPNPKHTASVSAAAVPPAAGEAEAEAQQGLLPLAA